MYADDTTLIEESKEELRSLLMKVKEESEKAGLKLNILKTKIMASGPITSWKIEGETKERVTDYFLELQNHCSHGDCSHEIKIHFLLVRKAMRNLDSILQSRHVTLTTMVRMKVKVHGILQARILEWVAITFSSGSSKSRD